MTICVMAKDIFDRSVYAIKNNQKPIIAKINRCGMIKTKIDK